MATQPTTQIETTPGAAEQTKSGPTFRPNVDIVEKADELVVLADVPGTRTEDINIQFEDGTLTIHGKVTPRRSEEVDYLLHEYEVGDFYRTFRVSEHIDAERIHAEFDAGVLVLHLPKTAAVKPRKIKITST